MNNENNKKIGQFLIDKGLITQAQLDKALARQSQTGQFLGLILLDLGFIYKDSECLTLFEEQYGIPFVSLKEMNIPEDVIQKIPPKFATYYNILPIKLEEDVLTIATSKPFDTHTFDEINLFVKEKLKPALATEGDISEAIRKYYGVGASTIDQMMGTVESTQKVSEVTHIDELDSAASISNFFNQILLEAYRDRATDIHIEPFEDELQIRYRVDGLLYDAKVPSNIKHFKDAISSRIKILSNLNIAEKRKPQDGRFKIRIEDIDIDLRVSFLPTQFGESVVLRILSSTSLFDFNQLGIASEHQKILQNLIQKPHGIIFLTGPTGSGKTTTLYSCLSQINTDEKKIITIEDPIEYQLKGVTQIQINPDIDLTFAQGLRSMLRHDPDVMMVGEVRDKETADIAIQVALTGHLVFSTLHTNDAASGVARLLDMNVEPFLISSTIECLIAQRLVRLVCPECRKPMEVTEEISKDSEGYLSVDEDVPIYEANGCEACHFRGYTGQMGIYEFLLMSDEIRRLVTDRATANIIKDQAVSEGMQTLAQCGWGKVKEGLTTPQEVLRVTRDERM